VVRLLLEASSLADRVDALILEPQNEMTTRADPDGYHFVVLNVSINNTPVFVSAVVINKIYQVLQFDSGTAPIHLQPLGI